MSPKHLFTALVFAAFLTGLAIDRLRPRPVPAPRIQLPLPLSNPGLESKSAAEEGASEGAGGRGRAPASAVPGPGPGPGPDAEGGDGPDGRILRGRIVDAAGTPVVEAAVVRRGERGSRWGLTDADGRFELLDLPAGRLELDVLAWPWLPASFEVERGATAVEFALPDPPPELPRNEPLRRAALAGVLRDAAGDPLAEHEVVLLPTRLTHWADAPAEQPSPLLSGQVPRRATTGSDGSFAIMGLVAGNYAIEVRPPWARGASWPDLADAARADYQHEALADGPHLEVVTAVGTIAGRVVDVDGAPVEGALLIARSTDARRRVWPPETTEPDGAFAIAGLPPGRWDLEVLAGEAAVALAAITVEAGVTTRPELPPLDVRAP